MPRVPDILINSAIYLYRDLLDAEGGADIGGSGFLVGLKSSTGKGEHLYAVTCGHVVRGGAPVVRVNLRHSSSGYERTFAFDFKKEEWECHPDHDLAVCSLPFDTDMRNYDFTPLPLDFLLTQQQFQEMRVGPGDDLLYIGRFMGHAGKFQNMPSVRFGNISMNPSEDEPINYLDPESRKERKQPGFLVEARSRSGYSGSPVFLISPIPKSSPRFLTTMFGELKLLGIDFSHIPELVTLLDSGGYSQKWKVEIHAGMMGVIPSWYLLDFINTSPRLIEQRRRDDELYAAWSPNAVLDGTQESQ